MSDKTRKKSGSITTDQEEITLIPVENYDVYIGDFAKRFYTPFTKESICEILEFQLDKHGELYILVKSEYIDTPFLWDLEDSVIITNERLTVNFDDVANVNHEQYNGYNPFNKK